MFSILKGFLLGLSVSIFNHQMTTRVFKNVNNNPNKLKKKYTYRIIIRYFLNLLVLFIVRKDVGMLIATAIGLTMVKNYLFFHHITGRKG